MRVNRRSLIQMLGLGAAAAALAPSVGQAAQIECPVCDEPMANDPHLSEHVLARHYVDPSPRLEAIHAKNVATARADGPTVSGPLTPYGEFLELVDACRARGCELTQISQPGWDRVLFGHSGPFSPRYQADTLNYETVGQIRLWLADLHQSSGPSFFGAKPVPVEEFDAMYRDAIANARADGYNRGREVESARWEARQDPSVTPSQVSRGWIYTQTGDGIVVERANA